MSRTTRRALAATSVAAVAFVSATASLAGGESYTDSVDLEIRGGAKVKSTIRGVRERERYLLDLPAGAVVRATAARRGRGALAPRMDLVDATDAAAAAVVVPTSKGAKLTGEPLADGGLHRLRVFGDGTADGDYTLSFSVKPQARWRGTGDTAAAQSSQTYRFAAPAGASARITLRAAPHSAFVPALRTLKDPDGAPLQALSGGTSPWVRLPETGEYAVEFDDGGDQGGAWICDVTLRVPKTRPARFDISAGALTGQFEDETPVYGRLAGDGEDLLIDPPDLGGPLDGASIQLQPGSLPLPLVVTMNPATVFDLPGGQSAAGGAVQLGPSGTNFADGKPATVSLPFDAALFTDPESELTVYVLDEESGVVSAVPKPYTFPAPGIVSFPTPHFSVYVPTRTGGASPIGDWVYIGIEGGAESDWGGSAVFELGDLSLSAAGAWTLDAGGSRSMWVRQFDDGMTTRPAALISPTYGNDYGTWSEIDPLSLDLQPLSSGPIRLNRSRHGHFMVRRPPLGENELRPGWMLRRASGRPTLTNVAGRWHMLFLSAGASETGPTSAPDVSLTCDAGRATATFTSDGKFTFTGVTGRSAKSPYPTGTWSYETSGAPDGGTWAPSGSQVEIRFAPDARQKGPRGDVIILPPDLSMRVALGGDLMVGLLTDPSGQSSQPSEPTLVLMVREASGAVLRDFGDVTTVFTAAFDTQDRQGGVQGLVATYGETDVTHVGKTANVAPQFHTTVSHDSEGEPVNVDDTDASETETVTLTGAGLYQARSGVYGFLLPRARIFVGGRASPDEGSFEFLIGVPGEDFTSGR